MSKMNDNIRELMSPAKLYTPEEEASGSLKARFKLIITAEINDLGAANAVYEQLLNRRAIVAAESLEELNRRTEEFIKSNILRPSEMITDGVLLSDGTVYELRYTDDFYEGGLPIALQTITALRFDTARPGLVVFIRSETEKGGKIEIDYTVDIGPVTVQKNRISIEAVPVPDNITEKDDEPKQ